MIPKVIYYTWFGRHPLPDFERQCIASWRRTCPDYQIIEINEDNFDYTQSKFAKLAYDKGVWSYVSDYARLKVLGENAGIYLDTDIFLTKGLDELLGYDAVFFHDNFHMDSTPLLCSEKMKGMMLEVLDQMETTVQNDQVSENILDILTRYVHNRWDILPLSRQVSNDNVCFLDKSFLPCNGKSRSSGFGVHCVRGSWIGSPLEVHNFLPFDIYQNGILDEYATNKSTKYINGLKGETSIGEIHLANVPFFGEVMFLTNFFYNKKVMKVVGNGVIITRKDWNGRCSSIYQFNGVEVWL